jgi:hypothetical protein
MSEPQQEVSAEFLEHYERRRQKKEQYAEFLQDNPAYPHYVPERDDIPLTADSLP